MIQLRKMEQTDLPVFRKWLYTPHVARWYHDPLDWIDEVEKQDGAFCWIHHFIVEHAGKPIGFCQYYACKDSEELWEGYTALGGSYSIDYMIWGNRLSWQRLWQNDCGAIEESCGLKRENRT